MNTRLATLLNEIVYKTQPMKAVESKGDVLPMPAVDNIERVKMGGSSLAEMLQAEAAAAAGDFVYAEDFFSGLQAEAAGANPG